MLQRSARWKQNETPITSKNMGNMLMNWVLVQNIKTKRNKTTIIYRGLYNNVSLLKVVGFLNVGNRTKLINALDITKSAKGVTRDCDNYTEYGFKVYMGPYTPRPCIAKTIHHQGSADRRCSNFIWVINNFLVTWGASDIRGLTVGRFFVGLGVDWCYPYSHGRNLTIVCVPGGNTGWYTDNGTTTNHSTDR